MVAHADVGGLLRIPCLDTPPESHSRRLDCMLSVVCFGGTGQNNSVHRSCNLLDPCGIIESVRTSALAVISRLSPMSVVPFEESE